MVTGRKAFESTSQASLIGAILHKDGVPFPVLDGLETNRVTGAAHFGVSNEGTLA
jgi:hypothetical protein